ncbi:MAG: diacylglycerol kinase family protein [Gemmatimonadales bacterium]
MIDVAVILNPASGSAAGDATPERIVELFATHARTATIMAASHGRSVADQARAAAEAGCRLAVAAGGDGTVNAVATAILGRDIPLGVLPTGTLNHFAKDLGLPLDLAEAVRIASQGVARRVDVGQVNGRVFLNNSSIGVYPRIVDLRQRRESTGAGKWLTALWASLVVLRRRPFMGVRIRTADETVVRLTPFVFVGNNEYRMVGLRAASRETLTGGRLALYVMRASRRRSLLALAGQVLWRGVDRVRELELFLVTEAVIETRRHRLQVSLDGEVAVLASPLEYRILPLALAVMSP